MKCYKINYQMCNSLSTPTWIQRMTCWFVIIHNYKQDCMEIHIVFKIADSFIAIEGDLGYG
jgi:hypothetical protein